MLSDIELLEIELRTIWAVDGAGRLVQREARGPAPHLVVATARDGWRVAYGRGVPENVARRLGEIVAAGPHAADPATPPAYIDRCREALGATLGAVTLSSGPSFRVPAGTAYRCDADIRRSGDLRSSEIASMRPESGWAPEEWDALIGGDIGPWAVIVEGGRVVSICHCSRLTKDAAEAGTWTDPAYRGRGYAAAATAAWANLMAPGGRHLFYSTSADNRSSQNVAARLGLPLIGWTWKLSPASAA